MTIAEPESAHGCGPGRPPYENPSPPTLFVIKEGVSERGLRPVRWTRGRHAHGFGGQGGRRSL